MKVEIEFDSLVKYKEEEEKVSRSKARWGRYGCIAIEQPDRQLAGFFPSMWALMLGTL